MSRQFDLIQSSRVDGALSNRNKIINGNFDIWQRGTSGSSGYVADRWRSNAIGSTAAISRQSFTLGQTDVPGEPNYYHRMVVTSSAGDGNGAFTQQRIESVKTLAGQTATLSFWAKADASKNMAVEFGQYFGTGGSPTTQSIGVTTIALTTSWQKFTVKVDVPSISGKALGTNNDDSFRVFFWFDAGSDFDSRTNTLGQQSGTFDIAQVQLEAGDTATPFEVRSIGQELALCQRYFEKSFPMNTAPANNLGVNQSGAFFLSGSINGGGFVPNMYWNINFSTKKRATPTLTLYNPESSSAGTWRTFASAVVDDTTPAVNINHSTGFGGYVQRTDVSLAQGAWTADAEL